MLHLGISWNSSFKLVKHCAKTYVRTGLGYLIRVSDEPSELEQILSEIWQICIIQQHLAVAQTDHWRFLKRNLMHFYSTIINLTLILTYLYSMEHFCYFFYSQAPNSTGANAFSNLTSNERSLETGQVIQMSLKPNERYDLNS